MRREAATRLCPRVGGRVAITDPTAPQPGLEGTGTEYWGGSRTRLVSRLDLVSRRAAWPRGAVPQRAGLARS